MGEMKTALCLASFQRKERKLKRARGGKQSQRRKIFLGPHPLPYQVSRFALASSSLAILNDQMKTGENRVRQSRGEALRDPDNGCEGDCVLGGGWILSPQ